MTGTLAAQSTAGMVALLMAGPGIGIADA